MVDFNALFSDKNFLSALAGMGAKFGRGGAGEAIGVPTQQMIQSKAAQEATAAQSEQQKKFWGQLIQALSGATPKEMPGLTGAKISPNQVTLDITPPTGASGKFELEGGSEPSRKAASNFDFSSILPF